MANKKNHIPPQSVYRRQLAAALKQLREEAFLTLSEVAEAVEVHQGSLSRIETAKRGTTPVLVNALLDMYGLDDEKRREDLLDLVRADNAQRKTWWRKYSTLMNPTQYSGYVTLESSAKEFRWYEAQLIPGLLQTEDYARQVITAMRMDLSKQQIDALVKVRMQRQALLTEDDAPKLWAVIDEAAIERLRHSPDILKEQLEHLLEAGLRTNVTLQFLPFDIGFHPALYGSFNIMSFAEPSPDVVWIENPTNSVCFETHEDVGHYTEVFDHLRATALGPTETRDRIEHIIRELK